jgi:hypothetical protein
MFVLLADVVGLSAPSWVAAIAAAALLLIGDLATSPRRTQESRRADSHKG